MSVWREVQEALYQRFSEHWVTADADPVPLTPYCLGNESGFDPPDGPWCRVSVQRMPGGPGTIGRKGNRRMDRVGRLFIQLFEPPGDGVGRISDLAETAARIFENCRLEPHDIRFAEVEPREGVDVEGGRWWGLPVEGRFDYEDIV